jgi:NADH-quinone oxidoreductase subunit N
MDALLILFIFGLISLFLGIAKKQQLALITNVSGLTLAFLSLAYHGTYESPLKSYENALQFTGQELLLGMLCILFTGFILLFNHSKDVAQDQHYADLSSLKMFSLTGALCLIGFKDFFMFFIGLEILSIPVYVLVGSRKGVLVSAEASLKYFFMGAFSTAILLFGIALVFGATGSFDMETIGSVIQQNAFNGEVLLIPGVLLILASLLFKLGAFPFHFWTADIYQGSSFPVLAYMSTTVKIAAFIAAVKLIGSTFSSLGTAWELSLSIFIAISLFLGYISALRQTSLKRILAFSGISNTGIGLLSVLSGAEFGERNLILFLLSYGASSLILMVILQTTNSEDDEISGLKGLGYKNPLLGVSALVALLSLAGIPPLTGFFGKMLLIQDILLVHPLMAILAILSSAIGAFLYIRLILLLFNQEMDGVKINISPLSTTVLCTSILCLIGGWLILYI